MKEWLFMGALMYLVTLFHRHSTLHITINNKKKGSTYTVSQYECNVFIQDILFIKKTSHIIYSKKIIDRFWFW